MLLSFSGPFFISEETTKHFTHLFDSLNQTEIHIKPAVPLHT